MKEAIMKNWSVTQDNFDPYTAPELIKYKLQGNVYGHPRFEDGTFVVTSSIQAVMNCGTHKNIKTRNTDYKIYPDDVDPEYEKVYGNAFEKIT